jgi:hypothetical protein
MLFGRNPYFFRYLGRGRLAPNQRYTQPRPNTYRPTPQPKIRHVVDPAPTIIRPSWLGGFLQRLADLLGEFGLGGLGGSVTDPNLNKSASACPTPGDLSPGTQDTNDPTALYLYLMNQYPEPT